MCEYAPQFVFLMKKTENVRRRRDKARFVKHLVRFCLSFCAGFRQFGAYNFHFSHEIYTHNGCS